MISYEDIEKAYSDFSGEIFSFIRRSTCDFDAAEDILQDVFSKLINYSLKNNVHSGNIRALLYTIARTVCIDAARKTSKIKTASGDISMLPDSIADKKDDSCEEMIDALNSLIDSLGEPEKSIFLLKRNGLTYSEIAPIVKLSERTLKRKVKNTIENMRKNLRNSGFFITDDTGGSDDSFN